MQHMRNRKLVSLYLSRVSVFQLSGRCSFSILANARLMAFHPPGSLWLLFLTRAYAPASRRVIMMPIFHINPGISVLNEEGVCADVFIIHVLTRVLAPGYVAIVPQTTTLGSDILDTLSFARNINRTTGNSALV